jgi:hypothetical protein
LHVFKSFKSMQGAGSVRSPKHVRRQTLPGNHCFAVPDTSQGRMVVTRWYVRSYSTGGDQIQPV